MCLCIWICGTMRLAGLLAVVSIYSCPIMQFCALVQVAAHLIQVSILVGFLSMGLYSLHFYVVIKVYYSIFQTMGLLINCCSVLCLVSIIPFYLVICINQHCSFIFRLLFCLVFISIFIPLLYYFQIEFVFDHFIIFNQPFIHPTLVLTTRPFASTSSLLPSLPPHPIPLHPN